MVLVIGNRENWGRKLGASAIREGMKLAFFDMRAEKLDRQDPCRQRTLAQGL